MKILHNNIEILNIQVDDSSYRYRAIKGDHNLTLYFSLAEHVEIPVGAYCVYENETYTLEKPESLTMKHSRYFEYTVVFDSPQAKAGKWKFRNPVDRRLKFPLTAKPIDELFHFCQPTKPVPEPAGVFVFFGLTNGEKSLITQSKKGHEVMTLVSSE